MANLSDFKLLLGSIPSYDGNPKTLTQFILNIEEIYNLINSLTPAVSQLQKQIVFIAIKNKIIGKANEELRNLQFDTWELLKTHLINNFADHQSPASIVIEIMKMNPNNKNIFKCLSDIKEKFDLFRAKINLLEGTPNNKINVINFQELVITNNFVCSLRDPWRNNLATRNPKTLLEIEQLLINDFQYLNTQNLETPKQTRNLPNIPPTRFPTQRFPTGPIHFKNNQQQSNFAPKQRIENRDNIRPTPMSMQTKQTFVPRQNTMRRPNNYFQPQTSNSPHYAAKEIFANDTEDNENNEFDPGENYEDNDKQSVIDEDENSFLGLSNIDIQEKF